MLSYCEPGAVQQSSLAQWLHNLLGCRYTSHSRAQQPLSSQAQPQQPEGRVASLRNVVLCNIITSKHQQAFDSCQTCQSCLNCYFCTLRKGLRNSTLLPYGQAHFHCCLSYYCCITVMCTHHAKPVVSLSTKKGTQQFTDGSQLC